MGGASSAYELCCECPGQARIILCGLEESGRTAVIQQLRDGMGAARQGEARSLPSKGSGKVGFDVDTIQFRQMQFTVWDVGSHGAFSRLHRPYFKGTEALCFVVDSGDRDRLPAVKEELRLMLAEEELAEAIVLVLANQNGRAEPMGEEKLAEHLNLHDLANGRFWHVQPCCAANGERLEDGLGWIVEHLPAPTRKKYSPCCAGELCCMGLRK